MPRSYLRLRFANDLDGTGELFARAQAEGFAGESSAYFGVKELENFASELRVYPPAVLTRREISSGFGAKDGISQEHLGIAVYPVDPKRGYIAVQVRMAAKDWVGARSESQSSARIEIITTYEPLCQFSHALVALVRGNAAEALLEGDNDR